MLGTQDSATNATLLGQVNDRARQLNSILGEKPPNDPAAHAQAILAAFDRAINLANGSIDDWNNEVDLARSIEDPEFIPGNTSLRTATINSLDGRGIRTIGKLIAHTDRDLLDIRRFGPERLRLVQASLEARNLRLESR